MVGPTLLSGNAGQECPAYHWLNIITSYQRLAFTDTNFFSTTHDPGLEMAEKSATARNDL